VDVVDEGDRIAHVLAAPLDLTEVDCHIDWERRFDHMQQHHWPASALGGDGRAVRDGHGQRPLRRRRAPRSIWIRRRWTPHSSHRRVEGEPGGLREPSSHPQLRRQLAGPRAAQSLERAGVLRLVDIAGLDRSACGGTHVRSSGEIGPVLIRKLDKVRNTVRVEFLCGLRASRRARADYESLAKIAQVLSATLTTRPPLSLPRWNR